MPNPTPHMPETETLLLVRIGELHLKGQNRPFFLRQLLRDIETAVSSLGGKPVHSQSRVYVTGVPDDRLAEAMTRLSRIFGIHSLSPAYACDTDFAVVKQVAIALMHEKTGTFKVDARRGDKRYPLDSPAIARELGGAILEDNPALSVDVRQPQHLLQVEIRERAYLLLDVLPGMGGMPVGTNGRAMCLLSGGIDSPVAAFRIMKRGVRVACVHFHAFPYTGERALEKTRDLARLLARYHGPVDLFEVPFADVQITLRDNAPESHLTVLMRRCMMRIAQHIARAQDCAALVTGESIGQVASQTLDCLRATDAVVEMPVFRPLIGMDKSEIIEEARAIGTLATSEQPFEDCCTLFTPRHPVTHPRLADIEASEDAVPNLDALLERAFEGTLRQTMLPG